VNETLDRIGFAATAACLAGGLALHAAWLPPALIGAYVLVIAFAAALMLTGYKPLPALLRIGVMLLLGALVIRTFGNPFGREAGSALLLAMLAAKMLETHTRRDARVVLTATCFVALAGFLFDQGPLQVALAFVVVIALLGTLALLADARSREPAATLARLRDPATIGARYALLAIPFAIVCFVLFPRLDSPLWGAPTNAFGARTGISDRMQPGMLSSLALDDTPVMRVRFDGEIPPTASRYFRGLVFWWFDGNTWAGKDALNGFEQAPELVPLSPALSYEVIIEPTDQPWLYALDAPRVAASGTTLSGDFQLRRESPVTSVLRYTGSAHLEYRMQPELPHLQRRLGLQLPAEGNPRSRALAARWATETGGDARAIAERALGLFNAEFIYSLEPPLLARDAVDDFLFETRIGFCEHFASAFAFLMRAAGVPARVVVGFQGGLVNSAGGYLTLRRADAHAWTEIWIDGEGWVRVDPTAAVAPERIAESARAQLDLRAGVRGPRWLSRLREHADLFGYWWNRTLIEFSALRQRQMLESFGAPPDRRVLVALLAIAALSTLGIASWWLTRRRGAVDPVLTEWRRFRARLARAGVAVDANLGPRELEARAVAALPDYSAAIASITGSFVDLRYRQPASNGVDADRLAVLRRAVRAFRPPRARRARIPRR